MEKRAARKQIAQRVAALSAEERKRRSAAAVRRVTELPEFQQAHCVLLFVPMDDELDVTGLIEAALRMGKRVCVPVCAKGDRRLIPARLDGLEALAPGAYGILEPKTVEEVPADRIDFVLVPAMGFDPQGNRLGRGAGYYDRFMSRDGFRAVKCGVAFDVQVLEVVPHDAHDLPVEVLVTDERVSRFGDS